MSGGLKGLRRPSRRRRDICKRGLQNPNSPAVSARPPYLFEPWRSMPSAWQAWREKGFDPGSAVPTSWRVGTPCPRPPTGLAAGSAARKDQFMKLAPSGPFRPLHKWGGEDPPGHSETQRHGGGAGMGKPGGTGPRCGKRGSKRSIYETDTFTDTFRHLHFSFFICRHLFQNSIGFCGIG